MRRLRSLVPLAALAVVFIGGAGSSVEVSPRSAASALQEARQDGIDLGRVVETVSHHVAPTKHGTLVARDRLYRAEFDASGFELRMHGSRFRLATASVKGAGVSPGLWRGTLNRAERELAPGITEHVTARDGSVEWDVVLAAAPQGAGDFELAARVYASGLPITGKDVRWSLGKGLSVRMGELVVKDVKGRTRHSALPDATRHWVSLNVPRSTLERAAYPLTIDPVISPEYPVTDPVYGTPAPEGQTLPSVAFGAGTYVVAWQDERSTPESYDIYAARVSQSGAVLDPAGIAIGTAANSQYSPTVAYHGSNYLVAWQDERAGFGGDIFGARVSQTGVVLDAMGIPISTATNGQRVPHLAFDGTNALVVWQDTRSGGQADIYGARVNQAGSVLDPQGIPISTAPHAQALPEIAFDGANYLAAWQDQRGSLESWDIYGARITPGGSVLDPAGIPISTAPEAQEWPSVAFGGTTYVVSWQDERVNDEIDIYGARVNQAGSVLDPAGIRLSTVANRQEAPSAAFDGTNYLVSWYDDRSGSGWDIYGARVSQAGTVLDPAGIPISTAPGDQFTPRVAFGGSEFLVAWEDRRSGGILSDIYAARVSQVGTVLDPGGIAVSTASWFQWAPSVGFDGTNYLVAWTDARSPAGYDIYGSRVGHDGVALDPQGIAISTAVGHQTYPSVAFDGTNSLVVWEDDRCCTTPDIYGARVTPAGGVLDPAGIAISKIGRAH